MLPCFVSLAAAVAAATAVYPLSLLAASSFVGNSFWPFALCSLHFSFSHAPKSKFSHFPHELCIPNWRCCSAHKLAVLFSSAPLNDD